MPVKKFRSLQAMEGSLWHEPGDPALWRAIRRVWSFATRTCPRAGRRRNHDRIGHLELWDISREVWMASRRSLRAQACLGLLAVLLPALAAAQPASLLLDLNQTAYEQPLVPGEIQDLRMVGGRLYFLTQGGGDAEALWVSDGTPAGTESLCPGRCSVQPFLVGGLGERMLWTAWSSTLTQQLWRSDGTHPGTFPLTGSDLHLPLFVQEQPIHAFLGRFFYFAGCSGPGAEADCDLWRTDGTAAGTRIFQEAPRSFLWMKAAGDRLYYLEQDGPGASLWVTDGTPAGTARLRRFQGQFGDLPSLPAAAGRRLFFLARTAGDEVWTSDGTAAGTRPVTQFAPDRPFSFDKRLRPIGNRVYFFVDDGSHGLEIWRSDGTAAGTVRITDFENQQPFTSSSLWEVGGIAIFRATDDQTPFRVWTSRGTPESTAPLPCEDCDLDPHTSLAESGGKVFFLSDSDSSNSLALWATDGTAAGTRKVRDLCITGTCSLASLLPWTGGVLFTLSGRDPQIWFSNGTPAGTRPLTGLTDAVAVDEPLEAAELDGDLYFLADEEGAAGLWVRDRHGEIRPVRTFPVSGPTSLPRLLGSAGNRLLFTAWDGQRNTFGLWSSAGTPETTASLELTNIPADGIREPVQAAGLLFFQVGSFFQEHDLWRTDGTAEGTFVVAHLQRQAVTVPFRGALSFFVGNEIWKTDGTVQGTVRTGDLPAEVIMIESATAGPNGIYLKTVNAPYKTEFWFTDGTSAGTRQITDLGLPGVTGWDPEFTTLGAQAYFTFDRRLWRTDGTLAGTVALDVLPPFDTPTTLTAHQGALYLFTADYATGNGLRLWRTDGTPAGTVELGRFLLQETYDFPLWLTPFAGKLYFDVDGGQGIELWATDGTPAGTALVRDLRPGPSSSGPAQPTVAGGRLFFTAFDNLHGVELWQSDGTGAGTRLVQDIRPQASSSSPGQLTVAGDALFFTADDGVTGREAWALPLARPAACQPSSTRLCLGGGRYAAEAAWRTQGRRGAGHAIPLTADTGYFWFFDPANAETVLKVLDGRGVNGHAWVFYGALSNVEYALTVTDTETGLARRYINPSGVLASVGDTFAFGPLGASVGSAATRTGSVARPSPRPLVDRRVVPAAATGSCAPSSTRLCLGGARFAVEIAWKDFAGNQGTGHAVELTDDTGWFWFFDAANVEVVLKVLDGTAVNGHHWLFYGALSSVEYTVTVTDTQTGAIKTYRNPSGRLASTADTEAF